MKWQSKDSWVMRLTDDGVLDEGTEELWPSFKLDEKFEDEESTESLVKLLNKMEQFKRVLEVMAEEANNPAPEGDGAAPSSWFISLAQEALK